MSNITGYRDLSDEEIELINEVKAKSVELGELIAKLKARDSLDQRWVAIAATDFQTGSMAAVRAIARPETF